jgi:aspartyl-tRNA(Asn)/glutamyl-tRNA(Gln) amidotransferase subunit C
MLHTSTFIAIETAGAAAAGLSRCATASNPGPSSPNAVEIDMSIDAATVKRVARLARLAVPQARLEPLAQELSGIIDWIEQLNEVDVDGVEPMTSCVAQTLPLREDVVTEGGQPDKILANAPRRIGNFFVVPKVVE